MPTISNLRYVLMMIYFESSLRTMIGLSISPPNLTASLAVMRYLSSLKNFRYLIGYLWTLLNLMRFIRLWMSQMWMQGYSPLYAEAAILLNLDTSMTEMDWVCPL